MDPINLVLTYLCCLVRSCCWVVGIFLLHPHVTLITPTINSFAIYWTCGSCSMASLGPFLNALTVAHDENILALMNINFDFSLYRIDAPIEFQALGNNISSRRRWEGELGSQHRTARRLRALFEGVLPRIPEFSRAYGRRVSEVSHSQR